MNWSDRDTALFDLGGVLRPTAEAPMRARHRMFTAILHDEGAQPQVASVRLLDHLKKKGFDGKPSPATGLWDTELDELVPDTVHRPAPVTG